MFHQVSLRRLSRSEKDAPPVYLNPILPGFNPDPSIIWIPSPYNLFLLTTSSFEYFPGIPIYCSPDLIQWTLLSHAINTSTVARSSGLAIKAPEPGGGVWAVTMRQHKGYVYVTSTSFDRFRPQEQDWVFPRGFYLRIKVEDLLDFAVPGSTSSSSSPVSPSAFLAPGDPARDAKWEGPVFFDQPGFDQDLFFDDDGTTYLSTTYQKLDRDPAAKTKDLAVHMCTIDLASGKATSAPKLLRESDTRDGVAEGSHLLKRRKYYYLFTAEGGTETNDHCEKVFRSQSPWGPWEANPHTKDAHGALWTQTQGIEVQNTGHADLVEDGDGRWWAVCLGVRPVQDSSGWKKSVFGRETFLMPVRWEDDWPIFNEGGAVKLAIQAPKGVGDGKVYLYTPAARWRDEFQSRDGMLGIGWYRKNTPLKPDEVQVNKARKGYLRLWGNAYDLGSAACPVAVFRKQIAREGVWRTRLDYKPESERTEAGTLVYWNYFTWSSVGIRKGREGRVVRFTPAEGESVDVPLKTADAEVLLAIECQPLKYRFGFEELVTADDKTKAARGEGVQWVGEVSTEVMTRDPPVGMAFTGMMLGLYAFGEMESCLVPADFAMAEFM